MLWLNQCCTYKNSLTLLNYEIIFRVGEKGVELFVAIQLRIVDNTVLQWECAMYGKTTSSQYIVLCSGGQLI